MGDDGALTCVRASAMVAVNNEGEHKEEAMAFLDFLMQPEHVEDYAFAQNGLSPLANAKTVDPLFAQQITQIEEGRIFSDTDAHIPFNLLKSLNGASVQLAEGDSLEHILNDFDGSVKAAMSLESTE